MEHETAGSLLGAVVPEGARPVVTKRVGCQRWNYLDATPIKRIHDLWIGAYAAVVLNLLDKMKSEMERELV